jgi:hypothetical protein
MAQRAIPMMPSQFGSHFRLGGNMADPKDKQKDQVPREKDLVTKERQRITVAIEKDLLARERQKVVVAKDKEKDQARIETLKDRLAEKRKDKLQDIDLEDKWREVTMTVPFKKNRKTGELMLEEDWWIFKAQTMRKDIWQYFDNRHSKGIWHLLQRVAKWIEGK